MRTKLFAAALLAGVVASVAPITSASAVCGHELLDVEGGGNGCSSPCQTDQQVWDATIGRVGPKYYDVFACVQ